MDIQQNCVKSLFGPWKFQGQKQRPLEIPYYFLLATLENSTSFLINPLEILHAISLMPLEIPYPHPPTPPPPPPHLLPI